MANLKHVNLFAYGERAEVYAALQRDYNRDTWRVAIWRAVFFGLAACVYLFSTHADWLWLLAGLYVIGEMLCAFIDNSNRNWSMHVIDWIESGHSQNNDSAQIFDDD